LLKYFYQRGENPMKIATPFLAALLLTGAALCARATIQGLLPALVSTAMELGLNRVRARVLS
jgi:hypothetical protein